jgi:hypothetical protein
MSKNKLCPQCRIGRFQVKNDKGEAIVVTVDAENRIQPIHEGTSLDGFNLEILYCLGCSWKGSVRNLI